MKDIVSFVIESLSNDDKHNLDSIVKLAQKYENVKTNVK